MSAILKRKKPIEIDIRLEYEDDQSTIVMLRKKYDHCMKEMTEGLEKPLVFAFVFDQTQRSFSDGCVLVFN